MPRGKTITLFLIDGDANGRIMCELSNWTGIAYKISRTQIKDSDDRKDLKQAGVYILFGSEGERKLAYIGESENVFKRLCQHSEDERKDFWNEAIVFVSKDKKLNKALIKYLENRLYEIAKYVDRYELKNTTVPTKSYICESDEADMEEFIERLQLLVDTLGYKIFEPIRKKPVESNVFLFYIESSKGVKAVGEYTNEGFLIHQGSTVMKDTRVSLSKSIFSMREKLISNSILTDSGDFYLLNRDVLMSSPSYAAALVHGRSANGLTEWKLEDGRDLKSVMALIQ